MNSPFKVLWLQRVSMVMVLLAGCAALAVLILLFSGISLAQTSLTLTPSSNPSTFGAPVTLTAHVTPAAATGRVTFYADGAFLGAAVHGGSYVVVARTQPNTNAGIFTIGDDARLSDQRIWAEVPGKGPDGCVLDAEGAIWMADSFGAGCFRIAEGGDVVDSVTASQPVYACTLGGADRRTLYLITAPRRLMQVKTA